eukprot:363451-Chlamydomonas_euryale.AAC.2
MPRFLFVNDMIVMASVDGTGNCGKSEWNSCCIHSGCGVPRQSGRLHGSCKNTPPCKSIISLELSLDIACHNVRDAHQDQPGTGLKERRFVLTAYEHHGRHLRSWPSSSKLSVGDVHRSTHSRTSCCREHSVTVIAAATPTARSTE